MPEMNDLLYKAFSLEFAALAKDNQPVVIELSKVEAWIIFSQLQLALRHPKNKGPSSRIAKEIAIKLEKAIALTPALAEAASRGWKAEFDV